MQCQVIDFEFAVVDVCVQVGQQFATERVVPVGYGGFGQLVVDCRRSGVGSAYFLLQRTEFFHGFLRLFLDVSVDKPTDTDQ